MTEHCSMNGLDLSMHYYQEVVKPLFQNRFPGMPFSAALLGDGSEVLGFDTVMSQDHDWGPRVLIFLRESDYTDLAAQINVTLQSDLPVEFMGMPTKFTTPNQVAEARTAADKTNAEGTEISHTVELLTIQKFFLRQLNFSLAQNIEPSDWLTFSEQKLATIVRGRIFDDEIGLQAARDRFSYYPKDIWLYLLACQWTRIEQEGHLMGRAGYVGDEIGSAIIAARLVRDLMRLCFLIEKEYAPYAKWFGSAFSQLKCAPHITPSLQQSLQSSTWEERQSHLSAAYKIVSELHNNLGITAPLPTSVRHFHDRPFLVISTGEFSQALFAQIETAAVQEIAKKRPIGSIDQWSDNTDLLSDSRWRPALCRLYQ